MSWRRLLSLSSEDVFKMFWLRVIYSSWSYVFKMSSGRFQDVFKTSSRRLAKTSSLQDILKASSRRFEKTSSRRLAKMSSRRFQDVSSSYTFLVIIMFLRRAAKSVIYTEGFTLDTLLRNYGQGTKFGRVTTVSKVLVFRFTTTFSGCLHRRI